MGTCLVPAYASLHIVNISSIVLTFALGAQKNRVTETVLRVHARFLSGSKRYIFQK